jgi:hypothetical protein
MARSAKDITGTIVIRFPSVSAMLTGLAFSESRRNQVSSGNIER